MSMSDEAGTVTFRQWVAVIGGVFGCFMAGMNVHVTNASLPEIEGSLGATFDEGSWITTAYLIAEIVIIPLTAWLVQVFSIRRVLLVGTSGFLVFSVACSFAPNIAAMIVIRALQGGFGGVLIPLSFQLIATELPASKLSLGMALFAIANNVAQAAGPSIGGWLTDAYSWRYIFYLQWPPGLLLLAAIAWSVDRVPMKLDLLRKGDWGGIAAMTVGLGMLQLVLEEGGRKDWFASDFILRSSLIAVVGLIMFVWIELRREHPFINLRLLGRYNFGIASVMQFVFGAVTFGVVFLVPNYFAQLHGYSARQVGMTMIPYGAVQLLMSFASPKLMKYTSARSVIVLGFVFIALGCYMNVHLENNSAANVIVPSLVVRGIGQSLVVVALSVVAIADLEKAEMGSASGLFSMVRNTGGAVGIAMISQVVVEREKFHSSRMGEAVSAYAPATRERIIDSVQQFAGLHIDRWQAMHAANTLPYRMQAIAAMDGSVRRQALLSAYADSFLLASVAVVACAVLAFALRSPKKPSG
jgi:MFS transporter, DHA2 family, multidrug resistance protein